MQHDYFPEFVRQSFQGPMQAFRIGFLTKGLPDFRFSGCLMNFFIERFGRFVLSQFLDHGVANISQDRHQPGLAVSAPKTGKGLVRAQVSLLHGILGILVVTQEPAGQIVRGIEMGQENLLKVRRAQIFSCIVMLFHHDSTEFQPVLFPENSFLFIE